MAFDPNQVSDGEKLVGPVYEFGPFRLDPAERQLSRDGKLITLPPKAFDTLIVLVQNNGHILKKDDLLKTVWPDAFVEENNLNQYISLLRKTLRDYDSAGNYIETIRRYGYRFTADVRQTAGDTPGTLLRRRTQTHVVIREETETSDSYLRVEQRFAPEASRPKLLSRRRLVFCVVVATTVLAGIGTALFLRRTREATPASLPPIRSIAVLPFKSIGPANADDEFLGLGIADALITKLGQLKEITVRPTGAIQKYGDDSRDPAQLGRELKVDVVLDGRYVKTADQLRLTAQMVNVKDGTLLWTGQFDNRAADLLAVQDSITEQAALAMRLQLSAWQRQRLAKPATTNIEAYHAYLRGRHFWNKRTLDGFQKGIEQFQKAIDLDAGYALAYSGLADCYNLLSEYQGGAPEAAFTAARQAAKKAIEVDESLGEAHASLAYVLVNHEWNWTEGEKEFKRALELNPNYATAHQWYSEFLSAMGRPDEYRAELARALELDPLSLIINAEQGLPYVGSGEYGRAIERFREALELDPNFPMTHVYLAIAYELSGQDDKAFAEWLTQGRLVGEDPAAEPAVKKTFECCGLRGFWRKALAHQMERRRTSYFSAYVIAQIHARIGEKEQALYWLEHAYKEHDRYLIGVNTDPFFAPFHEEPRFQDVVRRMNLTAS